MMTDNELNALVAEKVMEGTRIDTDVGLLWDIDGCAYDHGDVPDYCNDIAAAWQVVETLRGRELTVSIATPPPGWQNWDVRGLNTIANDNRFIAHAPTAPRAICLAALKAVGIEVE